MKRVYTNCCQDTTIGLMSEATVWKSRQGYVPKLVYSVPVLLKNILLCIIRKTLKGRKQTNKYGRGTEWHLPKTDESFVRPRVSIAKTYRDETKQKLIFRPDHSGLPQQ